MKLSIIIPCYNSGSFISETINMLISQGLDETELILVNDGSTDDTLTILKSFEGNRIIVINQDNLGVSAARNSGLAVASGEYVYFLDSDDSLTDGSLDFFRNLITTYAGINMLSFGYQSRRNNVLIKDYCSKRSQLFNKESLQKSFFCKKVYLNICSVLFLREKLNGLNIRFPVGHKIGEDLEFLISFVLQAESCYYEPRLTFIYQLRDSSATRGYTVYNPDTSLTYQKQLINQLGNERMIKFYNYWLAYYYISQLYKYLKFSNQDEFVDYFLTNKEILRRCAPVSFPFSVIKFILNIIPLKVVRLLVGKKT